jgi:small subunit ribosomal protein S16
MLKIRLFRIGRKHQPSYKVVVTDKRNAPRAGRFVEEVGSWNPMTKQKILKAERIKEWISKGAQPSDTVRNMLLHEKILEGKKTAVHKKSKKKVEPVKAVETSGVDKKS